MKKIIYILPVIGFLLVLACSSNDDSSGGEGDNKDDFNRAELTASWVNNLVLPAVNDLKSKLGSLSTSVNTFTASPDTDGLSKVRLDLFEAAKVWQHVEMFFFKSSYAFDMYTYPTKPDKILENINSDIELNLDRSVLNETQGLPAIDYLVNGLEVSDTEIITKYQDAKYASYLKTLADRMVTLTNTAISDFESAKATNIASVGDEKTSYFSIQLNDYVEYTEQSFREKKIATPSGTRNRDPRFTVAPSPDVVESLYSPNNSKALYLEAYDAIQDFYYGRSYSNDSNTIGLQDYLQFLKATIMVDGKDIKLDDYIQQIFANIDTANTNITANFYDQTQDYNTNFDAVFDAIQEFVIAIKSNVLDVFNLTIDFIDSDGD